MLIKEIPVESLNNQSYLLVSQEHLDGLPRGFPLVSACTSGVRSTTAASILLREGFTHVTMLTGGTNACRNKGYPVEHGAP